MENLRQKFEESKVGQFYAEHKVVCNIIATTVAVCTLKGVTKAHRAKINAQLWAAYYKGGMDALAMASKEAIEA